MLQRLLIDPIRSTTPSLTIALTIAALIAIGTPLAAQSDGPDVIVGSIPDVANYTAVGGIDAFAIGTSSCNVGDEPLDWVSSTEAHPVIAQQMYRLQGDRFEQVGLSWLKHGFFALQQSLCEPCSPHPNGTALGVGCSDPYTAPLNGSQGGLTPRSVANPTDGSHDDSTTSPPFSSSIDRRLQVAGDDLDADLNEDALYFVEGQYLAADDDLAGNENNNASYRPVLISTAPGAHNYTASLSGPTVQELPAIYAWQTENPEVGIETIDVDADGRFHVAFLAIDNEDGTWRYEYAVHNLNSGRAGGAFEVPIPLGAEVTEIGFHDVDYHSGEDHDGTDWVVTETDTTLRWETADSFDDDPEANALRWGTLYNFRFVCDRAPAEVVASLGLFAPDADDENDPVDVTVVGPADGFLRGDGNGDGALSLSDAVVALEWLFLSQPLGCIDAADFDDDGNAGLADVVQLTSHLFLNGPPPAPPSEACGVDPTDDTLSCDDPGSSCE